MYQISNFKFQTSSFNLIISLVFSTCLALCSCISTYGNEFEIKHADSLEINKNQIKIKGEILITYKNAKIEAEEGFVKTNEKGKAYKAIFLGNPKIKLKDRSVGAEKLTVLIDEKKIIAEGNSKTELYDKKNGPIKITANYQEVNWNNEGASAKGNIITTYKDTKVLSEIGKILYKNKKPEKALFWGDNTQSTIEQPSNKTTADELIFDIKTQNIEAFGNAKTTVWPETEVLHENQDPIFVTTENIFLDQNTGIIQAKSYTTKVTFNYQETSGESNEAFLFKDKETKKTEKIIFKGDANIRQPDKELISEEVVFSFLDKKLTSNTITNVRPKARIFK